MSETTPLDVYLMDHFPNDCTANDFDCSKCALREFNGDCSVKRYTRDMLNSVRTIVGYKQ